MRRERTAPVVERVVPTSQLVRRKQLSMGATLPYHSAVTRGKCLSDTMLVVLVDFIKPLFAVRPREPRGTISNKGVDYPAFLIPSRSLLDRKRLLSVSYPRGLLDCSKDGGQFSCY